MVFETLRAPLWGSKLLKTGDRGDLNGACAGSNIPHGGRNGGPLVGPILPYPL